LKILFYYVLYPLIRPFYLIALIINTLILALLIIAISPLDRGGKYVHYIGRFWSLVNVWLSGTRMYIRGKEKIKKGRPYIIMSNHQSLFDVWALIARLPLQLRWIIKSDIKTIPVFGLALERMGHFYVDRKRYKDAFSGLDAAFEKIKKGMSVVVFPEGTRSRDGRLQKFHKGGVLIALRSGIPILPVTVNGSRFVLPKGTLDLMPGKIEIVVGDLIDTSAFDEKKKDELMSVVKSAIEKNLNLNYGAFTSDYSR